MERLSIVGLPNAGKSSLFNAVTGGAAPVAAHPFSTTETNVGVAEVVDAGPPVYRSALPAGDRELLRPFFLLTNKPVLAVVNLGEDQLAEADAVVKPVQDEFGDAADVLGMSVQLEAEAAQLDPAERAE